MRHTGFTGRFLGLPAALIVFLALPVSAAPSDLSRELDLLAAPQEDELPGTAKETFGLGVTLDLLAEASDGKEELTYDGGARITGFLALPLETHVRFIGSIGVFVGDVTDDLTDTVVGELTQIPVMASIELTPSHPFAGTGRIEDEFRITPFATIGIGYHLYSYDNQNPQIVDVGISNSFAFEARIGLEIRLAKMLSAGVDGGFYWAAPGSLNVSTTFFGLYGEIRI